MTLAFATSYRQNQGKCFPCATEGDYENHHYPEQISLIQSNCELKTQKNLCFLFNVYFHVQHPWWLELQVLRRSQFYNALLPCHMAV